MGASAGSVLGGVGGSGIVGSLISNLPHNIVINAITQKQQADYNEAVAKRDAQLANIRRKEFEHRERQIEEQGSFAVRQQRLQQEALLAQGQVAGAASGVQLGSGSILDWEVSAEEVFAEDRRQLDYDIANRVYEARIGAWNANVERISFLQEASNIRDQRNAILNSYMLDLFGGGGILAMGGLSLEGSPSEQNGMVSGTSPSGLSDVSFSAYDNNSTASIGADFYSPSESSFSPSDLPMGQMLQGEKSLFY